MLNCHSKILILFEAGYITDGLMGERKKFYAKYPRIRQLAQNAQDPLIFYYQMLNYFNKNGHDFSYIGEKYPGIDKLNLIEVIKSCKVIYTLRDVRTWLVKDKIKSWYATDKDISGPAIQYLLYFRQSIKSIDSLFVMRLEDLVKNYDFCELSKFLNLDFKDLNGWWEKRGGRGGEGPKKYLHKLRQSSRIPLIKLDTNVVLRNHPFWDDYLPIFDKYYNNYDNAEVDQDLKILQLLGKKYKNVQINHTYKNIESISF